jgi:hypothetical protein
MGFVEDHQLVEASAFMFGLREDPKHDNEQPERFMPLNPLVAQIDDHGAARTKKVS